MRWSIAQWFEKQWWTNYLKDRDVEEYLTWKRDYWTKFCNELYLDYSKSTIDLGCGPAGLFILPDFKDLTSVDPLLDKYQESFPLHFQSTNATFIHSTLEDFTIDQKFGNVCSFNCINHTKDIDQSVKNIVSCASPNAKIYISVDVHKYQILRFLLRLFPFDILHPHQMNIEDYRSLFVRHHLKIEQEILSKKGNVFDYFVFVLSLSDK
jgi:SAM-dependent methyltransferase